MNRVKCMSFVLTFILLIAVVFSPVQPVHAQSTSMQIEDVSIEWIVNESNYKKAILHVLTNEGTYDFLLEGNINHLGSETAVAIDVFILTNEEYVYTQSITVGIPDILCDAPYVPESTAVEAVHFNIGPWLAGVLRTLGIIVSIIVFVYYLAEFIVEILAGQYISAFMSLLKGIFYASIPWVFVAIYDADKCPDGSLHLYVPYDAVQQALVNDWQFYLATPFNWWFIEKQTFLWIITYYVATWVRPRMEMPPPSPLAPSASFAWCPDTIAPGQEVTFVSTSYDPDGEIRCCHWFFGDCSEAYGETVTHVYSQPGSYDVKLEVIDNEGLKRETSTSIMEIPFFVIPEAHFGTISLILGMICALGLFMVVKRPKRSISR